jgi:hypothetical protein
MKARGRMNPVTRLAAMSVGGRVSLLAVAAAILLAGCGGDEGTIPGENSDQLLTRLDEIEGAVAEGQCEGAQASADLFVDQVAQLPGDVDQEVKRLLTEGGERLQQLATEQCEEPPPTGASGEEGFQPEEETVEPAVEPTDTDTEQQTPDEGGEKGDGGEDGSAQDGGGSDDGGGNQGGSGGNQGGGTGTGGVGGGGD